MTLSDETSARLETYRAAHGRPSADSVLRAAVDYALASPTFAARLHGAPDLRSHADVETAQAAR